MRISARLNPLVKRFVTSFAPCWSRLIRPTKCYTNYFFELNFYLFYNDALSHELASVVKMATSMLPFFKWNSVHIHHVSAQRDKKFERAWKFSFSTLLDSYGDKLLKINVISQINFLTLMDWKYPTKAEVNQVNAQYCFVKRKFRYWLVNCKNCRTVKK